MNNCEGCNTAAGQDLCAIHGEPRLYPDGNVPGPDFVKDNQELRDRLAELQKEYALLVKDRDDWRAIAQGSKAGKRLAEVELRVAEVGKERDRYKMSWNDAEAAIIERTEALTLVKKRLYDLAIAIDPPTDLKGAARLDWYAEALIEVQRLREVEKRKDKGSER